ncbi:hypothetical protein C8R44DRAFT_791342 [Mycena epipterygia]|nr:hypothetical protein C8R44DRAFT_791342 [Mycena epipterygia]
MTAVPQLFQHFFDYQRVFLARTLAFSRDLNSRNLEGYWYIIWNHTLIALVDGLPHLLVAPQYPLWCVVEPDAEEPEPPAIENDGEATLLAVEVAGSDDDEAIDEAWEEPSAEPFSLEALDLGPAVEEDPEVELEADLNPLADQSWTGSVATIAQSRATSQITDFAIVEVTPRADPSLSSTLGKVFAALCSGMKFLPEMTTLLRTRRADSPVDKQLPRVLVEIKRYIHRNVPEGLLFNVRLNKKLYEAQAQLMRQAAILFCMSEATARVVVLVAAVGPYYTTAQVRRKKKVNEQFVKDAVENKDMDALRDTLVTPRWTKPRYLGTQGSDTRLREIRSRLEKWEEFEKTVLK